MPHGGIAGQRTLLNVKINNIEALPRQAQGEKELNPVNIAKECEKAGCNGITVHLREDRRHNQDRDIFAIKEIVQGKFNLEIGLSDEMIHIAAEIKPDQITLVSEKREEMMGEGGLGVKENALKIKDTVKFFHDRNISVSLLIEPDIEAIDIAKGCGADFVEFHTGAYSNINVKTGFERELERLYKAADHAAKAGIKVSVGHGLHYGNIEPLLNLKGLTEVNIGHAIFSRASSVGLTSAVYEMLEILE